MTLVLVHLLGAVALMLWGIRMVGRNFANVAGARLKTVLLQSTNGRMQGFLSGMSVTVLLQSSTATILLLVTFFKHGVITTSGAIAVVLGADVGTTLVAQILSFDMVWVAPLLIALGFVIHSFGDNKDTQDYIGRIIIGLGIVLLSLSLIKSASMPIQHSSLLPEILHSLQSDPLLAIGVSAILTWLIHSSLAAVLLFGTLMGAGILPLSLGLLFVLGANIGGAIVPLFLTWSHGRSVRILTVANLFMRCAVVVVAFIFLHYIISFLNAQTFIQNNILVHFHTGFNLLLAVVFLPLTGIVAKIFETAFPPEDTKVGYSSLRKGDIDTPVTALSNARRETLKMAELIQLMLKESLEILTEGARDKIKRIADFDDEVDAYYSRIKLYITQLLSQEMIKQDREAAILILNFSTRLEHMGDIIDKSFMHAIEKTLSSGESFSDDGLKEIKQFHEIVVKNLHNAIAVFETRDKKLAQKLLDSKKIVRNMAEHSAEKHYKRMGKREPETLGTSLMHLDIIRDLRQINSYATRVVYDVLY